MRTIKFRGKRIDNGVWVYGYYFIAPLTIENFGIGRLSTLNEETIHCIADLGGVAFHVDKMTISQFTGMQDIYKKDIYEGDIVKYRTQSGNRMIDSDFDEWISEVEYLDGVFHPRYIE